MRGHAGGWWQGERAREVLVEAEGVREVLVAERELARERVTALEREFAGLAEAASAAGTDDEHDPEGATLAFERQHAAALLAAAREQVAALDAALRRLAEGRYGVCDRCGRPIGAERLAARPAALTCIRCAGSRRALNPDVMNGQPVIPVRGGFTRLVRPVDQAMRAW